MFPLQDADLLTIGTNRVRKKLFANRSLPEGTAVSVRLNLNYGVKKDNQLFAIQTVHSGHRPSGSVLGYDKAVTVSDATFYVNEAGRASIRAGHHKYPMAAVCGRLKQIEPSLEGVALRFNPKNTTHFQRVDDARPVIAADEVTIFNTRAYARGRIIYLEGSE